MSNKAIFYITGPMLSGKSEVARRIVSATEFELGLYESFQALKDHMLPELLHKDNAIVTERVFDWGTHDKLRKFAREHSLRFITFELDKR